MREHDSAWRAFFRWTRSWLLVLRDMVHVQRPEMDLQRALDWELEEVAEKKKPRKPAKKPDRKGEKKGYWKRVSGLHADYTHDRLALFRVLVNSRTIRLELEETYRLVEEAKQQAAAAAAARALSEDLSRRLLD